MTYQQKLKTLLVTYKNQDLWREIFGFSQGRPQWDALRDLSTDPEAIEYVNDLYAQLLAGQAKAQERLEQETAKEQVRLQYENQGVVIDPDAPPNLSDLRGKKVWLYHGTSTALTDKIKKDGLLPGKTEANYGFTRNVIFLTARMRGHTSSAEMYARLAANKLGGKPIIYRVLVDGGKLRPDPDDHDIASGRYQYVISNVPSSQIKERIRLGTMKNMISRVATRHIAGKNFDLTLFKKLLLKNRALLHKLATIQHPPRKPRLYFNNMAKRLRETIMQAKKLEPTLMNGKKQTTEEFLQDSHSWLDLSDIKRLFTGDDWNKGSLDGLLQKVEDVVRLINSAYDEDVSQYDRNQYWRYFQNTLKYFKEDLDSGHVKYVVDMIREKAADIQEFDDYQGEDYVKDGLPKGFVGNLLKLADLIDQAKAIVREAQPKLEELIRLFLTSWQTENEARPASDKVETLYHTSVNARRIYTKGFDPVVPKTEGLGGSQEDKSGKPAISFTSDLYIAKEIMRTLREAILVAKGQVKAQHILEWAERAGIKDDVMDSFRSIRGTPDFKKTFHVVELYRIYLTYAESKGKLRYNPLFFGDMEALMRQFKGMNPRDVGILVCSVDMTDPNISYLASMHEYRVNPKAVISIDKMIA